jgi:DNA (cytosine-5)-methyltransferase 1
VRLLDLYCGGGGAAMGYHQAGFDDITGVDIAPQPRYPFAFVQADALEYLAEHGHEYDLVHASPPCQGYSIMNNLPWLKDREYPLLILPTIEMLEGLGKPYVLENVMGARHGAKGLAKRGIEAHGLQAGWLCGTMFGLPFYRHRLFATNWFWMAPGHPRHRVTIRPARTMAGRARDFVFSDSEDKRGAASWPGRRETPAGTGLTTWQNGAQAEGVGVRHAKGWRLAAEAMGIDWMKQAELTQAIPPAYTRWIGEQWLEEVE